MDDISEKEHRELIQEKMRANFADMGVKCKFTNNQLDAIIKYCDHVLGFKDEIIVQSSLWTKIKYVFTGKLEI